MGWLRKLGRVFSLVGRGAAPFIPVPLVREVVLAAIDTAEELGAGRGGEKKRLATRLALSTLRLVEAAAGRDLYDEERLAGALGPLIDDFVEYRNLTQWRKAA